MTWLSVAGRYLPEGARTILRRHVYPLVPYRWRMGSTYRRVSTFTQDAQWWDRRQIQTWQLARLKAIVGRAYSRVPGYTRLYREAGVEPSDIQTLDDISRLPFTTKELLRDNMDEFRPRDVPVRLLTKASTGGSTGVPLGFYQHPTDRQVETAFVHLMWGFAGWKAQDRIAVLRGGFVGSTDKVLRYDRATNQLILSSFFLADETYDEVIGAFGKTAPDHLHAFPSAARALAELMLSHGDAGTVPLKSLLLGSENIYAWQREALQAAFPEARVFAWYGHSERAVLAPWCEQTDMYHAFPLYGITEVVDDHGHGVADGQIGEIVGTSLWSRGTPFIRYRTADYARKGGERCEACGRYCTILTSIEGRAQEFLVTATGRRISMAQMEFHSQAFEKVRRFQFYQDIPGKVVVRILPDRGYSGDDEVAIRRDVEAKLGADTSVDVVLVDDIPLTARGKQRIMEQRLPSG